MQSTPNASTNSMPTNNDAEQRRRAIEVGSYIKKLLDAYRLLEAGHASLPDVEATSWKKVTEYISQFGEISMEISPTTISIEGKNVVEANRKSDSVSYALFAEGIHEILFGRALTKDQLEGFLKIWAQACLSMTDQIAEEKVSIATRTWESDYDAIELIAMQTVQEGTEEEGSEETERRDEIKRAIHAVSGAGEAGESSSKHSLIGGSGATDGIDSWARAAQTDGLLFRDRLSVDDDNALRLLSAELHLTIMPEESSRGAPPTSSITLSKSRLDEMSVELSDTWSEAHTVHYISSVFMLAQEANSDELEALIGPLEHVFTKHCISNAFAVLGQAIDEAKKSLLASSKNPNYCYQVIEILLSALKSPKILDTTIDALDQAFTRDEALRFINLLPAAHVLDLIERVDRLCTPLGINAILNLIAGKNPKAADLARCASQSKPDVARAILRLAKDANVEDAHLIRKTVLCHPDPKIRKNILDSIRVEDVPANIVELRSLITDQESQIREAAMLLVVQAKDSGSIAILSTFVAGEYSLEEQKKAIVGIARIGGTEAGLALRKVLLQQKNVELRCVSALSLGEMGDQSSRPLFEKEMNRVLSRGKLKASCAEAIRRLDAHLEKSSMRSES
jgi:hypothetical protein